MTRGQRQDILIGVENFYGLGHPVIASGAKQPGFLPQ